MVQIAVNNAIRDSHMDLPPEEVKKYYAAYKRFHNILYANAMTFKMEQGEYCGCGPQAGRGNASCNTAMPYTMYTTPCNAIPCTPCYAMSCHAMYTSRR